MFYVVRYLFFCAVVDYSRFWPGVTRRTLQWYRSCIERCSRQN